MRPTAKESISVDRTYCFSPATDTCELPRVMRGCPPTTELHVLDLQPSPPTRHYTPRARWARRWHRVATSGPAGHVRESISSAFWPCAVGLGVIVALLIVAQVNGPIPFSVVGR